MSLEIYRFNGNYKNDAFGYAVASGDINGDNKNEIIIASINKQRNGVNIFIYPEMKDKGIKKITIGNKKVNTVRLLVEDINQDNIDELIIGITYQDLSGEVKILSIPKNKTIFQWNTVKEFDAFGFSIAIGDVNGDGIKDILVGAPNPIKNGKGAVYAYSGQNGSLIKKFTSAIPRDYCDYATSIASADLNNDGIDEIIIGSPGSPKGEVLIYSGIDNYLVHKLNGEPGFGTAIHTADINGDGIDELIVTSKNLKGNTVSIFGKRFKHLYDITNKDVDIGFGEVITSCDINGDGMDELILGAFDSPHKRKKYTGQITVYNGTKGNLLHRWYGKEENDQFGFSLASTRLHKSTKDSLLIGAPREIFKKKGTVYLATLK